MTQTSGLDTFIGSTALAERLGVNRATVNRWRIAGYLPLPCYADGSVTLWAIEGIEQWETAGRPWSQQDLAREHVRRRGAAWLDQTVAPEPTGTPATAEHDRLVEQLEAMLNECDRLVLQLGSAVVADRFDLLRQAILETCGGE